MIYLFDHILSVSQFFPEFIWFDELELLIDPFLSRENPCDVFYDFFELSPLFKRHATRLGSRSTPAALNRVHIAHLRAPTITFTLQVLVADVWLTTELQDLQLLLDHISLELLREGHLLSSYMLRVDLLSNFYFLKGVRVFRYHVLIISLILGCLVTEVSQPVNYLPQITRLSL